MTIAKYARERAGVVCRRALYAANIGERARRNATRQTFQVRTLKACRGNAAAKGKRNE